VAHYRCRVHKLERNPASPLGVSTTASSKCNQFKSKQVMSSLLFARTLTLDGGNNAYKSMGDHRLVVLQLFMTNSATYC
jgi:hypothetical protein